ncbi:MAG: ABC-F family ATP-binding cassette domain-containing protein [Gemmatimonadota bacterium]|nr:ABC-F family ATP-binding cassette domain-containing protein [Gemmatimonadota bacterium]
MISASGVGMSFGDQVLFRDVSFQLNQGECYGLVGANGSGKTTLLNILSGELEPTEGSVNIPRRARLGVLRQDQFLYEDEEILGVALMGNPELWDAMVRKEALLAAPDDEFDADLFSDLEEIVQRHDGYTAESRAAEILEGLGFPTAIHRDRLSTLSGGFKLRVLLAQTLAGSPDVLLLDEPTNHLDILSIRWLEKFLQKYTGSVVVISHDHRFLDNVSSHILDVDYEAVTLYTGNYDGFLTQKAGDRERREKEIANREREIAHHQVFVDRFRAKASKARQAQSRVRMIEKKAESLEALPQTSRRYPNFRFEQRRPSGREVLKITGVRKAFEENQVLHGVDLEVARGDRIAIMGPNGIGKSTLLKIVMDDLAADDGEVEWGYETHPSYFAQDHKDQFENPKWSAEEWITSLAPGKTIGFVRGELARVLFSGDDAAKRLGALSGGEAARLVFCRIAIERPNVLVLDEPTNHLDLESIEALVESLREYDGTLIFVSHDRWFVGQLATRVVEITEDDIRDFVGTYEEYVHFCGDDHLDVDTVVLKAQKEKRKAKRGSDTGTSPDSSADEIQRPQRKAEPIGGGISPNRLREMRKRRDRALARVEKAELRIAEIDEKFCQPDFYESAGPGEVSELEGERERLQGEMAERFAEWERLEAELARVDE